jgi:hypothetical protein
MPTSIITGRDITFTIDGDAFEAQATSGILTIDSTINTYQTLDGKAYFTTDTQGTFNVEMLQDFGTAGSLCEALWTAAKNAPKRWIHLHNGGNFTKLQALLIIQPLYANSTHSIWHHGLVKHPGH